MQSVTKMKVILSFGVCCQIYACGSPHDNITPLFVTQLYLKLSARATYKDLDDPTTKYWWAAYMTTLSVSLCRLQLICKNLPISFIGQFFSFTKFVEMDQIIFCSCISWLQPYPYYLLQSIMCLYQHAMRPLIITSTHNALYWPAINDTNKLIYHPKYQKLFSK
jgi:hypothetical protein